MNSTWKRIGRKLHRSDSGQATIEFAIVLFFLLSALFLVIQLSLVYAFGNFAQYATFMAARTLLSAGPGDAREQEERAVAVLQALLKRPNGEDRWPGVASTKNLSDPETRPDVRGAEIWGIGQNGHETVYGFDLKGLPAPQEGPDYSWMLGVRYRFRSRLFLLDWGQNSGARSGSKPSVLDLISESWLGREPGDLECLAERKRRAESLGRQEARLLLDNGC